MFRWWKARRARKLAIEAAADEWLRRHGRYAEALARDRAVDAYSLGDLVELERWASIREVIRRRQGERSHPSS
jgi:hypothetical protein